MRIDRATIIAIPFLLLLASPMCTAGSLDSSDVIFHYRGTDTLSRLGAFINSIGDVNGDGVDDIAISSYSPMGTYIFYGGEPVDTFPDMFLSGAHGPASAIDVTGDGINDLIVGIVVGNVMVKTGKIYFYRGLADSLASIPFDSIDPTPNNYDYGYWLRTEYVDGDALGDMITTRGISGIGQELLFYSGAPTLDTVADWRHLPDNPRQQTAGNFGFVDFNGDGELDVYAARYDDFSAPSFIEVFLGPDFGDTADVVIGPPADLPSGDPRSFGEGVYNIGDIDVDGWEDLGVRYSNQSLVYLCGPVADTLYDYLLQGPAKFMAKAGDINGDGDGDLVVGGLLFANGTVDVYLGGREFDVYYDDYLRRSDLPPRLLDMIGYRVSAAGDFTADGIDDFMFSCQNFHEGEPNDVFVVRGSAKIVTDVEDTGTPALPRELSLAQNYPNPFNLSTTIEFELPRRERVSLIIFNIIGRQVATLIDNDELPAGRHRCSWDGTTIGGQSAASGLYLYRLRHSGGQQVKKMLLLK